jgi:WD40 repeat protein
VNPITLEVPVVAGKARPKPEAISERLVRELAHPNSDASFLVGLQFSPDGRRLIAGDYPGGVVATWDVENGRMLTSIETGKGYRGSAEYFFVSSDWQTLFGSREGPRDYERIEQHGKKLYRWTFDGDIRTWDLQSGRLKTTYKHQPPHWVRALDVSPDGKRFVTLDEAPGVSEARGKLTGTLWDAASGKQLPLPSNWQSAGQFSPDGRTIVGSIGDDLGYTQELKVFDATTGWEKRSIPIADKNTTCLVSAFSPDGRLMAGGYYVYDAPKKWDSWRCWLKVWDCESGREIASFAGAPDESFYNARFSPDGGMLISANQQGEQAKIHFFRIAENRLEKSLVLANRKKGDRILISKPEFSPDGQWLALTTQGVPETTGGKEVDIKDVEQPRIHVIDMTTREISATLIGPPAFTRSLCFSPDGQTLASGGHGKVLLWNLSGLR